MSEAHQSTQSGAEIRPFAGGHDTQANRAAMLFFFVGAALSVLLSASGGQTTAEGGRTLFLAVIGGIGLGMLLRWLLIKRAKWTFEPSGFSQTVLGRREIGFSWGDVVSVRIDGTDAHAASSAFAAISILVRDVDESERRRVVFSPSRLTVSSLALALHELVNYLPPSVIDPRLAFLEFALRTADDFGQPDMRGGPERLLHRLTVARPESGLSPSQMSVLAAMTLAFRSPISALGEMANHGVMDAIDRRLLEAIARGVAGDQDGARREVAAIREDTGAPDVLRVLESLEAYSASMAREFRDE